MKIFFILQVIIVLTISASGNNEEEVNKTFKLLKEGDEKIELNDEYKSITLVVGNTGSGKSTFVQWFAGDNSKLIAKEVTPDSGDFIIVDNDRINSGINSKTIFPELVVKKETNEAFYDCPGFSDTRNASIDIANTYFIKKLTDFADYIKIVFVVNYSSVKFGEDRLDFPKLLKHAAELVKDVKKYESSIAIAVTKVTNDYVKVNGSLGLVPDETIVQKVADYMKQVQQSFIDKRTDPDISEQDKKLNENAINLLDILLAKNAVKNDKIGLFRKPDETGPLSENKLMQQSKKYLEEVLRNLKFTQKSNSDFGYTISDKSLNYVRIISDQILKEVENNMTQIVEKLTAHYENSARHILDQLENFDNFPSVKDKIKMELNSTMTDVEIISSLMENLKNLTNIDEVTREIELKLKEMEFVNCDKNIGILKIQGKYLNFFETVSNSKLATKSWDKSFKPVDTMLQNSNKSIKDSINNAVEKSIKDLEETFKSIMSEVEKNFNQKSDKNSIDESISDLNHSQGILNQLIENLTKNQTSELSDVIKDFIRQLDINSLKVRQQITKVSNLLDFVSFLNDLGPLDSSSWLSDWISSGKQTSKYFIDSEVWFKFLKNLFAKYSTYEVQKSASEHKNLQVTTSSFNKFMKDLKDLKIEYYDENTEPNDERVNSLNQVLSSTFGNAEKSCSDSGEMIVKGDFIKVSDFTSANGNILHNCKSNLKSLKIFAMNTFFVDRDLNEYGRKLQVSILAPKWWIVDSHKINLDGEDNQHVYTQKAEDGKDLGHNGANGKPGLPGGNAGNFVGIGREFINIQSLSISANGGRGSRGQDGGNGAVGRDGGNASTYAEWHHKRCWLSRDLLVHKEYECVNPGEDGKPGGNGGDAGAGGLGGANGKIKVVNISNEKEMPKMIMNQGSKGDDGTPGRKGRQGKHGDDYYFIWCKTADKEYLCPDGDHKYFVKSKTPSEDPGTLGGITSSGIKQPENPTELQNVEIVTNDFKKVLRENFGNVYNFAIMLRFFDDLNDKFTSTLSLTNDLSNLVKQEYQLNSIFDRDTVTFFYETILNQTSEFSKTNHSLEHKKVLGYLYTAVVSRLYNIKVDANGILIVDLDKYLGMVKGEINKLRNLQEKNLKSQVIKAHNEKYKSDFDGKVDEAHSFIENQVNPEIKKTKDQLNGNIETLIDETLILQQKGREEEDKLKETRDKLKIAIITSRVFSVLTMSAQILGCFTGVGAPLAGAIGTLGNVVDTVLLDGTSINVTTSFKLPDSITDDLKSMINKTEGNYKFTKNVQRMDDFAKFGLDAAKKFKDDDKKMKAINDAVEKLKKITKICKNMKILSMRQ